MPQVSKARSDRNSVSGSPFTSGGDSAREATGYVNGSGAGPGAGPGPGAGDGPSDGDEAVPVVDPIKSSNLESKLGLGLPESERRAALIEFVVENEGELLDKVLETNPKLTQDILAQLMHVIKTIIGCSSAIIDQPKDKQGTLTCNKNGSSLDDGDGRLINLTSSRNFCAMNKNGLGLEVGDDQDQDQGEMIQLTILRLREVLVSSLASTGLSRLSIFHLDSLIISPAIQEALRLFSDVSVRRKMDYKLEDIFPVTRMTAAIVIDLNKPQVLEEVKSMFASCSVDWRLISLPPALGQESAPNTDPAPAPAESFIRDDLAFFYNANLAIIDISMQAKSQALLYYVGVRESYGRSEHILLCDKDVRSHVVNGHGHGHGHGNGNGTDCHGNNLDKNGSNLNMVEIPCIETYNLSNEKDLETFREQLRMHVEEMQAKFKNSEEARFVATLKKIRENLPEKERSALLVKILDKLQSEASSQLLTAKIIVNLLLSFRDTQDYERMIKLIETTVGTNTCGDLSDNSEVIYLYAFALIRRNRENDCEKALELISRFLHTVESEKPALLSLNNSIPATPAKNTEASPNASKSNQKETNNSEIEMQYRTLHFTCLHGRIYKDKFVNSNYTDEASLLKAIECYRRAYQLPHLGTNEIAMSGINLMTLLVVSGVTFPSSPSINHQQPESKSAAAAESQELESIGLQLNYLLGKKGSVPSLRNYWDLATIFELSILTENWGRAREALEFMTQLKPSHWCVKSTLGNVKLIQNKKTGNIPRNIAGNVSKKERADINILVDCLEQIIKGGN